MRRLRSIRRHVPLDRVDEYLMDWTTVRLRVESCGGRAWIFRGADHEDQFMEFVEWSATGRDPLGDGATAAALAQLDAYAVPSHADEWEEAT